MLKMGNHVLSNTLNAANVNNTRRDSEGSGHHTSAMKRLIGSKCGMEEELIEERRNVQKTDAELIREKGVYEVQIGNLQRSHVSMQIMSEALLLNPHHSTTLIDPTQPSSSDTPYSHLPEA